MDNHERFDLWADDYDQSVRVSDDEGRYPFAGYKAVLNKIYSHIVSRPGKMVLDLGFGTGVLTTKLYEHGYQIYGQDFSARMIELAYEKMPDARLYQGDFSVRLDPALMRHRYDFIIATYSLHHLPDEQKVNLLHRLMGLLNKEGRIYIGDIAFSTRKDREISKIQAGKAWDDDEIYFIADELKEVFPQLEFEPMSHCAGVFCLRRSDIDSNTNSELV